jgi:hypothetical protein
MSSSLNVVGKSLDRFDFLHQKEKAMARLAKQTQVAARVVLENDCNMGPAFKVLLDRLDGRDFARQCKIHDVRPPRGPEPDAISGSQFRMTHVNAIESFAVEIE